MNSSVPPSPSAASARPLAERLRPESLDQYVGQAHLVGAGKPIRQMLERGAIHSMIFWGPPGVGKTTLARLIAQAAGKPFYALSAVSAGKDDMRQVVERARLTRADTRPRDLFSALEPETAGGGGVILFLDEIHRFNKAQQDFLLPYVEDGTVTLIGATTENPSFEVISALLSRAQVFVLEALTTDEIAQIVRHGADVLGVGVHADAVAFLSAFANGDARLALNLLEATAQLYASAGADITVEQVREALQSKHLRYDKGGEEHFNTISAFIKSMRASHPDAALYYLARMVDAGEDPRFIARRMVIFASEDVGMADPTALLVANAAFAAVEQIGYPECQINLAHAAVYLATAPKSRASYDAYFRALDDVKQHGNLPIPLHLRNAPTQLLKDLGYGRADSDSDGLPDALRGRRYYDAHSRAEG